MQKVESAPPQLYPPDPADPLKALLISLAPLVMNWLFIGLIASRIYFWDEWDGIVGFSNAFRTDGFSLSQFWVAHNEHRFFLPRVFFLLSDLMFRDARFLMFLNSIVCWLTLRELSIGLQIPKSLGDNRWKWFTYGLLSFFFFSWIQTENFFWGFQLSWFMEVWAAVAATRAFVQKRFLKTAVYFVIAYLSHAAWVALLAILVLIAAAGWARSKSEIRRSYLIQIAVLIAVGALGLALYLPGLHRVTTAPFKPEHILKLGTYVLTLIGLPFCGMGRIVGTVFGAIFLLASFSLWRRLLSNKFALGLVLYTVVVACVFALGRYQLWDYKINVPFRYASMILPGWIALAVELLHERRAIKILMHFILTVTTIDILLKYFDFEKGAARSRDKAGTCLARAIADPNDSSLSPDHKCALFLYPDDSLFTRAKLWTEAVKK